ncbi:hypothetical protein C8R44DRAFT_865348 [Mycena epipterygia]|nr:hypothetical protein C8R44DRAFT_865348 [Mycena epipterygia]
MAGSLPADILVELFRFIPHWPDCRYSYGGLLDAAAVNRNWRTAEMNAARFGRASKLKTNSTVLCSRCFSGTSPLDIISKEAPLDIPLLAVIFQQCAALTSLTLRTGFHTSNPPLSSPGSDRCNCQCPRSSPASASFQQRTTSLAHCLRRAGTHRNDTPRHKPTPHPRAHAARPLLLERIRGPQRPEHRAGRRRFRVSAEDSECYETGALWAFLVAHLDAQRTVRTLLGTTVAWSCLTRVLERAISWSRLLKMAVLSCKSSWIPHPTRDFKSSYPPLDTHALRTLTLQPTGYSAKYNIQSVLWMLAMVCIDEHGVVVCLGKRNLDGVPPRRYLAEYQNSRTTSQA